MMNNIKGQYIGWIVFFIVFMSLAFLNPTEHTINIASKILVMGLFATAFNLLFGTTGLLSFGHALFFGLGAYITGMVVKSYGAEVFIPMVFLGGIISAIVSILLGFLCLRLTGVYFTMLTLAFAQLVWGITIKWYNFTGGDDGIQGIERPPLFDTFSSYYILILIVVFISMLLIYIVRSSPFGMVLRGIGQNPKRITFLGMNVYRHCLFAYVISAFFSAIAGGLFAGIDGSIHPNLFFWTQSGGVILMTILGGLNSFFGPLIGATIFIILEDVVIRQTEYWSFVIGVIMLSAVIFLPKGVISLLDFIQRLRKT
ncbi:MAG: branched-chain amino acid ABC transporter permease [Thermodesulfovibrionales bacterium]|nr:branched-chain amino acid ABC transporter permease [Thermodesulfovibrionales bacterium]